MKLIEARQLSNRLLGSKIVDYVVARQNEDDGYTFCASIRLLKRSLKNSNETLKFVRSCEKPYGGFTVIPLNFTPCMEQTYYDVMMLDLFGEKIRYPQETLDWILKCQNQNGGFARSDLGISSFVDTFHAVATLQKNNANASNYNSNLGTG